MLLEYISLWLESSPAEPVKIFWIQDVPNPNLIKVFEGKFRMCLASGEHYSSQMPPNGMGLTPTLNS